MTASELSPAPAADWGVPVPERFDDLPAGMVVSAFGVEYAHLRPPGGGDLYVTRLGWPDAGALHPARWYADQWYARRGVRLPGSTGHVYRVRTRPGAGRALDLVVKFSRVAQDVPVVIEASFPENVPASVIAEARFNSPLEEFGLVMELRRGAYGPRDLRILTHRPLAIWSPPEESDLWELGRSTSAFHSHRSLLAEDQDAAAKAIELDIRRMYVLLYGWLEGEDAEACFLGGGLEESEFLALTPRVASELEAKGFRVLDTKPKHFILRRRRRGGLLRRPAGNLVYGLVDFELLQRSAEHQRRFEAERRERYWHLQCRRPEAPETEVPPRFVPATVFGVDYIFGAAPDGGEVWVVGHEGALFDYFLPDRWRRTRRLKLSAGSEVYRTRTRDDIDIVYRRSRVGLRPRVDPFTAAGKRSREAGYNSPFEEVAIAERLRRMGIPTVYPRAIFCTGHESVKAIRLRDPRRFADHASHLTPGPGGRPILRPDHDYYTLWDTFRGMDPLLEAEGGGIGGVLGLERARDDGLLTAEEMERTLADARERLSHTGFPVESLSEDEFVVCVGRGGVPPRSNGVVEVVLSLDALTAYECGLLAEEACLALIRRMDERLRAVDCEKLDPNGRHLLLTMDPDGRFRRDASGELHVTLGNFALIRGLYRPIR